MWDPDQYQLFRNERAQPFLDLLNCLPDIPLKRIADLGCGTGDLTRLLAMKWREAQIFGIDSSSEMLERAHRQKAGPNLIFEQADLRQWQALDPLDCIISNAALHWLPDHRALLEHLAAQLAPGGILAVQMPNNRQETAYRLLAQLVAGPRWSGRVSDTALNATVEPVEWYLAVLEGLGLQARVWETIYYHQLQDAAGVVQWLKGSVLRPVLADLSADESEALVQELESRVAGHYRPGLAGVIFPFRRLFLLARA